MDLVKELNKIPGIEIGKKEPTKEALIKFKEDYNIRIGLGKIDLGICIKHVPRKYEGYYSTEDAKLRLGLGLIYKSQ